VARLALGAELAAVRVLVAVGAGRADVAEHERAVAALARGLRVRALELEAGRLVLELRLRDIAPALRAVALGAVAVERAVRVAARGLARDLRAQRQHRNEHEQAQPQERFPHLTPPFAAVRSARWQPAQATGSGL
jgi:hypothetical protein